LSGCDPSCQDYGSQGQHLAANVNYCYNLLNTLDPDKPIYIWNDMFDPYHNANWYPRYQNENPHYLSWEGLDSSIIISNWNQGATLIDENNEADEEGIERYKRSLDFFHSRGHRQILAGYYDNHDVSVGIPWFQYARTKQYTGMMYTTWQTDFSQLQEYIDMAQST